MKKHILILTLAIASTFSLCGCSEELAEINSAVNQLEELEEYFESDEFKEELEELETTEENNASHSCNVEEGEAFQTEDGYKLISIANMSKNDYYDLVGCWQFVEGKCDKHYLLDKLNTFGIDGDENYRDVPDRYHIKGMTIEQSELIYDYESIASLFAKFEENGFIFETADFQFIDGNWDEITGINNDKITRNKEEWQNLLNQIKESSDEYTNAFFYFEPLDDKGYFDDDIRLEFRIYNIPECKSIQFMVDYDIRKKDFVNEGELFVDYDDEKLRICLDDGPVDIRYNETIYLMNH